MPIEELLALYNCVPPPIPTTSNSSESTSKRGSRRARSSSAIQSDSALSTPSDASSSTVVLIGSTSIVENKLNATSKIDLAGPEGDVPGVKDAEPEKSNIEKAMKTIENNKLDLPSIQASNKDETEMKIDSDKVEAVEMLESKETDSVEFNRESEFTEMDDGDDDDDEEDESELRKLYPETFKTNEPRLLRSKLGTTALPLPTFVANCHFYAIRNENI